MTEHTRLMKQIRELIELNAVSELDEKTGLVLVNADSLAADVADRILASKVSRSALSHQEGE